MIKAFLFDLDDTLTRVSDFAHYRRGSHSALSMLLAEQGQQDQAPDFEIYQISHSHFYDTGACHFTAFAEQFGVCRDRMFKGHHDLIDESQLVHDVDSAEALNALRGRALIFSDGEHNWASRRMRSIGIDLPLYTREQDGLFERKCNSTRRFAIALEMLSAIVGEPLQPEEVLMFDDSASVLRKAKELGYKTAYCHYGTAGRSGNGGFDYEVYQVGRFLQEQGFVPALPSTQTVTALPAKPK